MKYVYKLQHKRQVEDAYENVTDTKLIGFFSTKEKAEETVERYKQFEGFRDYPNDFIIEKVELDFDDYEYD